MRKILALLLLPAPAAAWEFSPDPLCTLTHETTLSAPAQIEITFDAAQPLYTLNITLRDGVWPESAVFSMVFGGSNGSRISTTRHSYSANGTTLTVTDTGFGNVLDGLQFNTVANAIDGSKGVIADLADIGPAIKAFRACPDATPATS